MAEHDDRAFLELIGALAPCGEGAPDKAARTWEGVMKRTGLRPRRKRRIAPRTLLVAAALLAATVLAAAACLTAGDLFGGLLYESDGDGHFLPASSDSPMLERYGATLDLPPVKENGLTIQPRGFIGGGGHYKLYLDVAADPGVPLRLAQADGTLSDRGYQFREVLALPGPAAARPAFDDECRNEITRIDDGSRANELTLLLNLNFPWDDARYRDTSTLTVKLSDFQQYGWPPAENIGMQFENMQQALDAVKDGREVPFANHAGMTLTHASLRDGVLSLAGHSCAGEQAWEVAPSLRELRYGRLILGSGVCWDGGWEAQFELASEEAQHLEFVTDTTLGDYTLVPGEWWFTLPIGKQNLAKEVSLGEMEFDRGGCRLRANTVSLYAFGATLRLSMDIPTADRALGNTGESDALGGWPKLTLVLQNGQTMDLGGGGSNSLGYDDHGGYLICEYFTGEKLVDTDQITAVRFYDMEFPVS